MINPAIYLSHTYLSSKTKPILVLELYHILKADALMEFAAETSRSCTHENLYSKARLG